MLILYVGLRKSTYLFKKKKKVDIYLAFPMDDNTQNVIFQFISSPEPEFFCNSPLFRERL